MMEKTMQRGLLSIARIQRAPRSLIRNNGKRTPTIYLSGTQNVCDEYLM